MSDSTSAAKGSKIKAVIALSVIVVAILSLGIYLAGKYSKLPDISVAAEPYVAGGHPVTVGGIQFFNTWPTTWLAMAVFIIIAFKVGKNMSAIPSRWQTAFEVTYEFVQQVVGKEKAKDFFPVAGTFFFFILIANWMGLLPGYGSIGHYGELHGKVIFIPFLRAANAHLATTFALGFLTVLAAQYFGFKALGISYSKKFFNVSRFSKPDPSAKGLTKYIGIASGIIERVANAFVGFLELLSEGSKCVSFSFRLFGNIFAGEVLLFVISSLAGLLVPAVFMGLEVFVGLIQALIFSMLSVVFYAIATISHGDEHH